MGLWDKITKLPGKAWDSTIGGALDLGFDWLQNEFINKPNAREANENAKDASALAFERSYGAYKKRHQDTMADMKQAGLNPILAASGGFNVGSSPQASNAQSFQAASPSSGATKSGLNLTKQRESKSTTKLNKKKALQEIELIAKTRAQKGLITKQEELAVKQIRKIVEETELTIQRQMQTNVQTALTEQQERYIRLQHKTLKMRLIELSKTAAVYGAPAGHILKVFELIVKSLTPFKFNFTP